MQMHNGCEAKNTVTAQTNQLSKKELKKMLKVKTRRSIEEYIEKKRMRENNADIAELYCDYSELVG